MPSGKLASIAVQSIVLIGIGAAVGLADLAARGVNPSLKPNERDEASKILEELNAPKDQQESPAGAEPATTDPDRPTGDPADSGTPERAETQQRSPEPVFGPLPGWPENHRTLEFAKAMFESGRAVFVDARIEADYLAGHIPGAHFLPVAAFEGGYPDRVMYTMDPDAITIVYCSGGEDCEAAEDVAIELRSAGFKELYILHEGFPGWLDAGLPVETGADPNAL